MRISTKGRYGLRALADLAANSQNGPVPLAQIARRQKLSLNYLEQVFGILRRAGIVSSVKGASGGYRLACDMDSITVKEIFEVLEGKFSIVDGENQNNDDPVQNVLRVLLWNEIDRKVNTCLEEKTLGAIVREYRKNLAGGTIMYYI